jgi:ribokinase
MDMDELPAPCLQADRFHELAQVFDVILVNRNSAKTLTQCPDIDSICAALWILASQLDTIFLLTLGSEGVRVLDPKSNLVVVPAVAAEAIDTTGAGDVFAGVFLSCWLHGLSVVDAAQKGNLAGALATQALGALGYIPRAIDL